VLPLRLRAEEPVHVHQGRGLRQRQDLLRRSFLLGLVPQERPLLLLRKHLLPGGVHPYAAGGLLGSRLPQGQDLLGPGLLLEQLFVRPLRMGLHQGLQRRHLQLESNLAAGGITTS
jgi:hypothetical protein